MPSANDTMRIAKKPVHRYPWYLRPFFWNQRRKYGAPLDSALLWARAPRLFLGVATLYGMIDRRSSPIEPALRSLITVRVSQINHCPFCVDLNSATLLKRGASAAKVEALDRWRASDLFNARERLALEYAEAMTYSDRGVEEDLTARLKRLFDDDAIVELTGLVAFQNLSSKFNSALGVAPQGFCRLPEPAAIPRGTAEPEVAAARPLGSDVSEPLRTGARSTRTHKAAISRLPT